MPGSALPIPTIAWLFYLPRETALFRLARKSPVRPGRCGRAYRVWGTGEQTDHRGRTWLVYRRRICDRTDVRSREPLIVAADNTVFKYPEAQLGFTGGLIASAVARIPHKIAMEFMLLGQDISAERAYEVGMVDKVVPKGLELEVARGYRGYSRQISPIGRGDSQGILAGHTQSESCRSRRNRP